MQKLHDSSDDEPGIRRQKCGRGFTYNDPDGNTLKDAQERQRIENLAIPPAWTDVWICTSARGHLQATGMDAKGRKQYLYHPGWREQQESKKFEQLLPFGRRLPRLRRAIDRDMRQHALSHTRVTAAALRLLDLSGIRVGNERYRLEHGTFGLTTLRQRHVDLTGSTMSLTFNGKGGRDQSLEVVAPRVARVVRRCEELPGQELWTYKDQGKTSRLTSDDINAYIKTHTGIDASAKTFRIWIGSVSALEPLVREPAPASDRERKRRFLQAVDIAREVLNNTRAVCRSSYLHPAIERLYMNGELYNRANYKTCRASDWLAREEAALKRVLKQEQSVLSEHEA